MLSCNGIDNDALLGDYFSKNPPFEERIDKVAEFKDAFISYTLKRFAEEKDIKIKDDIRVRLTEKIEDTILSTGVWVDGAEEDCDIVNIEVKNICLSYTDDIEDHTISAHFDVVVVLTVDYSCIDEDNSYWAKEESAYLFLAISELRITKELQLDFCTTLSIDDNG